MITRLGVIRGLRALLVMAGAIAALGLMLDLYLSPTRVARGVPDDTGTGLQIDKIGPVVTFAGDWLTYTIKVTNTTGSILDGVIITDTWNQQVYSGSYEFSGAVVVNAFTLVTVPVKYAQFNLAPLPPNSLGILTVTMWIPPQLQPRWGGPAPIQVGNSVVITTSTPGVTANTARADTLIVAPLLVLTKFGPAISPRIGRLLTYTLKLENKFRNDSVDATHVVITERLPNNTLFYSAYPPDIGSYFPATNTVQWNLTQTLPVSGVVYVTVTTRITPTALYGNITNGNTQCAARADGMSSAVAFCAQTVTTLVADVFEKVGQTVSPPQPSGTISRTFPNRIMTYTISVFNPFTQTITGLIVTDTLPTFNNVPTQTFQFVGLVSSSPPAQPAVISQSVKSVSFQLPDIPAWGQYDFTFQAFVPPQMRIDDNATEKQYQNAVAGSYAGLLLATNDGGHDDSMKVKVMPQIILIKSVTPTAQYSGLPVTYTIVVSNSGPTTITDIQLADYLPAVGSCAFQWDSLVSGQAPLSNTGKIVSWSGITLTGYAQTTLATFRATVSGSANAACDNTLQGYSPDTYIVRRTNLARVTVLAVPPPPPPPPPPSPGFTKSVTPTSVVLGGRIQYSVTVFNRSTLLATMEAFTDVLPGGFYYNSSPIYADQIHMDLLPNHGNAYGAVFNVDVISTSVACDSLPATVYQAPGKLQVLLSAPPELAGVWTNPSNAAGVLVRPQAQVFKIAAPTAVLPGDVVTFTITLSNNTNSLISSLRVTDTLPNGFVFGGELPGTPPHFAIQGSNVFWNDLSLAPGSTSTLAFTVTATSVTGTYDNWVKAGSLIDPAICLPKTSARVAVQAGIINLNKTATVSSIGPLGQFNYNVSLNNVGPYTVTVGRFTETLPGIAGYPWNYIAMQSGDPLPINTNPLVWSNLAIGPGKTQNLRFTVRTDVQVGTYPNLVYSFSPAGFMTGTVPLPWVLKPVNGTAYSYAPVTVVPGVGLAKEVYPEAVLVSPITGTLVVYTITLANVSGSTVSNVRITDTLPNRFTFDSYVAGEVPLLTNPPVWSIGAVANGEQKIMVFRARVAPNTPSGTYYNRLMATANNLSIAPTGDTAPVVVSGVPTLNLSKAVDPAVVVTGREVTYTLTLVNPDLTTSVTARLTDTLPANFAFAAMINGPTPILTTPLIVWDNVMVPTNTVTTFIFRASTAADTPDGTYYNQLDGSSRQVVFPGTGQTAPVLVTEPVFDVQVSKTDQSYTATIGGSQIYTIYYTNTLNPLGLTAGGVVITDTFAPADFLIADAPGWNLVAPGIYTYFVGDLPAGASGALTLGLQINSGIPTDYQAITNTAEIGTSGALEEPEAVEQPTDNNTSSDIDTIRGADLAVIGMTYTPLRLSQNNQITVVVTLQNQGMSSTTGPDGDPNLGWFGSDLYVKPTGAPAPTGPADRYLGFCSTSLNPCPIDQQRRSLYLPTQDYYKPGLAPGQKWVLTYTYVLPSGGLQWLYFQADTFWAANGDPDPAYGSSQHGRIVEGNELNNIYGPISIYVNPSVYLPLILKQK